MNLYMLILQFIPLNSILVVTLALFAIYKIHPPVIYKCISKQALCMVRLTQCIKPHFAFNLFKVRPSHPVYTMLIFTR